MYKAFLRPLLFLLSPERAHHFTTRLFQVSLRIPLLGLILSKIYRFEDPRLEREVFGLKFKNPIGLAAGFDKQAHLYNDFAALGFGFIEVGTVTPKSQSGNPKPRMFRLPADSGLINRMGFNNDGLEAAIHNLKKRKTDIIIGGNIGKNKITPNKDAIKDYELCFEGLYPHVDYFVVNVSSPNTPGLRELQDKEPLKQLLNRLQELNAEKEKTKPILLKIAPDLTNEQLDDIITIVSETKIAGVVATNTTISRENLHSDESLKAEAGGLSGAPVRERATEVIRYLFAKSGGSFPIIGVGGVMNAKDVQEKLDAGASLVQVYTGLIYEGPTMVSNICKQLVKTV